MLDSGRRGYDHLQYYQVEDYQQDEYDGGLKDYAAVSKTVVRHEEQKQQEESFGRSDQMTSNQQQQRLIKPTISSASSKKKFTKRPQTSKIATDGNMLQNSIQLSREVMQQAPAACTVRYSAQMPTKSSSESQQPQFVYYPSAYDHNKGTNQNLSDNRIYGQFQLSESHSHR